MVQPDAEITTLLTDSRKFSSPEGVLFFAIRTTQGDGCRYVADLYQQGVRNFVVPAGCHIDCPEANVWFVGDVVGAMQAIASAHRAAFSIPVVGITGSNGKTIVKDWLVQLMGGDRRLCVSPKSYNSQIGVPLSVWQLADGDDLAIFEAGISKVGEMCRLQKVIRPTIGLFTNIGSAHDENFTSREQKIREKLQLFTQCDVLVYCADQGEIDLIVRKTGLRCFTWGKSASCDVQLIGTNVGDKRTVLDVRFAGSTFSVTIPFVDRAAQINAMHCIALMLLLGYRHETIAARCKELTTVEMRMEMIEATSNCLLINDSYSLDMASLTIALDYLQHDHRHNRRTLILSDFVQSGVPEERLYAQVSSLVRQRGIDRLMAIGPAFERHRGLFSDIDATFFPSTDDFVRRFDRSAFSSETILLKGARVFGFERIAQLLQRRSHETVMEVDLDALVHNLKYYRSLLRPSTRLMAMVKAASYGAGRVDVASALQLNGADYLTVAYADEGVELRRGGITLPIMVMNPEESAIGDIVKYCLEPDIYSFRILDIFAQKLADQRTTLPIHIELDTGMHRLGFGPSDLEALATKLAAPFHVSSIFSHLACSEDPSMDDFTRLQIRRFDEWSSRLKSLLPDGGGGVMRHLLNSSGITRFPEAQMDMVRLGIGLYGVSPEPEVQAQLRQVSRLVTRISQIKDIPVGDSVGYNRAWVAPRPTRLAILSIGYADGLNRHLAGTGHVLVNGHEAPIVGKVCMDMCFVDVTGIDCQEGDCVIFFGEGDLLQRNAAAAGTIPYEILTSVSPRVKRVYTAGG